MITVILLVVFFGIPAFLSSSAGTGFIVNKVNKSLDGEIGMEDLNVGWFKGVTLKKFSFADDAGSTKVNVREITAKPSYTSMLSGNISLGKVVLDRPEISITLDEKKKGSTITSHKTSSAKKSGKNAAIIFNQIDLTIKDGDIKILPAGGDYSSTLHFSNIASNVDLKPAGKRSRFDVGMDIESNGRRSKMSANGNVESSKKGWNFKDSEGDMTVKVDGLDLATLGPVFALLGKDIDIEGELNVDAEVKFGDGQIDKLVVDAKLDDFKHVAGDKVIALDEPLTLKGRVSTKYDKVNIENINLSSSFCTITGKGTGSELDYVAKMDIAKTMDFVGTFVDLGGYSFTGSCYEEGKITFRDDTIRFSDHSSIDNFVMSKKDEKGKKSTPMTTAKFTFDMTVDTKNENLKIDFLTMKTTDTLADIRIDDSVFSWAEDAREKVDMKIKADVDLAEIKPFALFFEAMDKKMDLAGRAKSELAIKSNKKELRIVTEKTTITKLKVAAEGVANKFEDDLVNVKFDMTINQSDKTLSLKEFSIDGTKIDIEGNFTQRQVKNEQIDLSGKVTAKYDIADVSTMASTYLPEGIEVQGKRSDAFTFQSRYPSADKDKLMANMNATGKFGFDNAKYMGMKIGKVDIAIDIKDGMVDIAPFTTSVNGGKLNFAGSVDLTKKPAVFKTAGPMQIIDKVQVDDEMGKALLKYLNPLFAEQADISGIGNLYCEKFVLPLGGDTAIADALIDGTVSISGMKMKSKGLLGAIMSKGQSKPIMNADMLDSRFVMDKGVIRYDDMQINIDGAYPINFRGAVNLNAKPGRLDMIAALPYTLSIRDGGIKSLRIGDDQKGRIELPIEGTVDNNRIDWDGVLKNIGQKAAEEFLQEGLKDIFKKSRDGDNGTEKSDEERVIEGILDLF